MILSLFSLSPPAGALGDSPGEPASDAKPESVQTETIGDEPDDAISRLKFKPGSMPEDMEILNESWATRKQLIQKRQRVDFRLAALLSQTLAIEDEKAQINYMVLPDKGNVDFGYSKLAVDEGDKSMIFKKDGMLLNKYIL